MIETSPYVQATTKRFRVFTSRWVYYFNLEEFSELEVRLEGEVQQIARVTMPIAGTTDTQYTSIKEGSDLRKEFKRFLILYGY